MGELAFLIHTSYIHLSLSLYIYIYVRLLFSIYLSMYIFLFLQFYLPENFLTELTALLMYKS